MTRLSAKQQHAALSEVIALAAIELARLVQDPNLPEEKLRDYFAAFHQIETMRSQLDA